MTKFNISYERDGVYQTLLINAESEEIAKAYFMERKPDATVCGIHEATRSDERPGKPVIDVPADYVIETAAEETEEEKKGKNIMKNFDNTLFLECRGCYFFGGDKITKLSDVGNYRIGAYINEIKSKNGKSYILEFGTTTRRALRKTNKRTGKPLKNPVVEITQENALCIDTQFENANGCWADLTLEKEITDMKLSYTKADILTAVNYISVRQYDKIVLVSSEKIIARIKAIYNSGGWRERNIIDNLTEIKTVEYNKNYWVFRFVASDDDYFEYEYNTNRITG